MPPTLPTLEKGRLVARLARSREEVAEAQALRARRFRAESGAPGDVDRFDDLCAHLLVEDRVAGGILGCVRLMLMESGAEIGLSYSSEHYDLSRLSAFPGRMMEIGRLCAAPGLGEADAVRALLCALTRIVDAHGVEMIFGCTSFRGTDAGRYRDTFALLRAHLAPPAWRPGVKAPRIFPFARCLTLEPDRARALRAMPPLLRSYLGMGGRVSDHAVVDEELGTLHVFTAVEVASIPPARKRVLRAAAAG
ncbi:Putative hemolysin [Meinhardsimonia xiamenensis]|jgi:putative hemolysin|uniref:L-ornithine N(alpha)-acyltransferase n=1 Tax=Meinhardsimonia xiamenensis TaxID=990712 RepID=A0A1G9BFG3_9RHOB|nr:GNAT family N-acyltransferase [Meinhardsimonia xiamenensis]PRX35013.1 putative hemolysin [Meinhardsimonia xiamenensis]SDK37794.1 Putative hemolysin [Meinhardsimonia xiamenensis]